jgi:YesN/AraC family two-component response regulator
MPEINGMDVARRIRENRQDIILVFITAFIDYAVEVYKLEAIRFLLKDTPMETLPECIDSIIRKLSLQAYRIEYPFLEGKKEIPIDGIYYIESRMHKLSFHATYKRKSRLPSVFTINWTTWKEPKLDKYKEQKEALDLKNDKLINEGIGLMDEKREWDREYARVESNFNIPANVSQDAHILPRGVPHAVHYARCQ